MWTNVKKLSYQCQVCRYTKTQENDLLEEVQASIRGARFAPQLTLTERITLIRDALERFKKAGLSIKTVKKQLWINEL